MTKASYSRLGPEEQAKHDEYMRKYYAGDYYRKQTEKYMPQCNKMDKSQLAYACTAGAHLFGMDHFAWKKLKELTPEIYQLTWITSFCNNPDIKEEAQELLAIFTA